MEILRLVRPRIAVAQGVAGRDVSANIDDLVTRLTVCQDRFTGDFDR
jgi:hypothetical protein